MIDIELIKSFSNLKHFKFGQVVITDGDKVGKDMYILLKGKAGVYKNYGQPDEMHLAVLKEGDFFGEMSLFLGNERTATVVAECDSAMLELGSNDTVKLIFERYPNIAYSIIVTLCQRLDTLNKRAVSLNTSKLDLLDKVHYDALTGIYNRRFLEESMERVITSLARSKGTLGILMIDVDFFKRYNDTYGHSMGDACLKTLAEALAGSISRPDDFVVRYGGEEFVIVLPDTDERGVRVVANKVLGNVRACRISHEKNDASSYVTISAGATSGQVLRGHAGAEYIQRADEALYLSKRKGRNRYTFIHFQEASL